MRLAVCGCAGLLVLAACRAADPGPAAAFPRGFAASPWILSGDVWEGDLDAATPALRDDAAVWTALRARRVWLARYTHERETERHLNVRVFEVPDASLALEAACAGGAPFDRGDDGRWITGGVAFRRGARVVEVFGDDARWGNELEAAVLATLIDNRLAQTEGAGRP